MRHVLCNLVFRALLFLLSITLTSSVAAGTLDWVFINNVVNKSTVGQYISYSYYSWHEVFVKEDEKDMMVADFLRGKGVAVNESSYPLGLQFYHVGDKGKFFHGSYLRANQNESIEDFLLRAKGRYATGSLAMNLSYGSEVSSPQSVETCVYLGGTNTSLNNFLNVPESYRYNLATDSIQSQCSTAPPQGQWCAMDSNDITIDFGDVTQTDILKKTEKTAKIDIYCTSEIKYFVRNKLNDSDGIALSNGLNARLELDDIPLNQVRQSVQGSNSLILKARLEGSSGQTGGFSGTGILSIDYP